MTIRVPPLILLELRFKTLLPINKLPHFHGPQWSALFRTIIKNLPFDNSMSQAGIWIQTVETGLLSYEANEIIHLGITFPASCADLMEEMVKNFNSFEGGRGHFQPGGTIFLEDVCCRIDGERWKPENPRYLTADILKPEIDKLSSLKNFTIHFYSPLRLPRPEGHKTEGHHYCDEDFFLRTVDESFPITHLLRKIRSIDQSPLDHPEVTHYQANSMRLTEGTLTWLDISYGEDIVKTIGGVVGKVRVDGALAPEIAEQLVAGQYLGIGKNPTFGLGFYTIPELDDVRLLKLLTRGSSLLQRAMSVQSLGKSLKKLPNSSPGPDMLTLEDIKKAGGEFLENMSKKVIEGAYVHGGLKKYRDLKEDGSYREIYIPNTADKLLQRTMADYLQPIVEGLLSTSSYAYRRGLNRKGAASALKRALQEGYVLGLKADISAFFDSVNVEILVEILEGLLPFEPLVERIKSFLRETHNLGVKGLPQGSPLSPLLSNIYLDRFDRDMSKVGLRLVRYSDDFVALFREGRSHDEVLKEIEFSLARLGLKLKQDKTIEVKRGTPIKFLGYVVSPEEIAEERKERIEEKQEWLPVFKEDWIAGTPVYLTSICRGAYSNGPSLVIKTSEDKKEEIPWNRISRMVVVGRSPFSGGVVYRAVKEEIPVNFIDVMGSSRGYLYPEYYEVPEIQALQQRFSTDEEYCLSFAKEIVSSKINNSFVLLRRNAIDAKELKGLAQKVRTADSLDSVRGYEGAAASIYFSEFAKLVAPLEFRGRVYHPPDGPVNVMLSLGYTMLRNRLTSVLRVKGFNPRIGFLHKGRGAHASLASDLLEELRHIVERIVLSLIHLGEIKREDFSITQKKGVNLCKLEGEGFRKYIHRFESTMSKSSAYHGGEKMTYNAYLDEMADKLKRSLKLNIRYKAFRID